MRKLKYDPITHEVININCNSRDMPKFLHTSNTNFFDFETIKSNNKKKTFEKNNTSTLELTDQFQNSEINSNPKTIKNISTLQTLLTNDIKTQQKQQTKVYHNKIFDEKKQFTISASYIEDHKYITPESYQKTFKQNNKFQKPSQYSKFSYQLNKMNSIMRYVIYKLIQVQKPVQAYLTTQQRNHLPVKCKQDASQSFFYTRASKLKQKKYVSIQKQKKQKQDERSQLKSMSFYNTQQKYHKTFKHFLNNQDETQQGKIYLNNALNNLLIGNRIAQILEKNKRKKCQYNRYN